MELKQKLQEALDSIDFVDTDSWFVSLTKSDIEILLDALNTSEIFNKIDLEEKQTDLPAPNTVMWWLCRIADPEIRMKAVGNCLSYHVTSKTKAQDINEAIGAGFMWSHTQEKRGYWKYLRCDEIPLLPEPDFTEYNELRK